MRPFNLKNIRSELLALWERIRARLPIGPSANNGNVRYRTPTVLQMEAVECGAASLGKILGYYKKFVPLEELRMQCGVSRDGSKASNIIKAARRYGLTAKGFKTEPDSLRNLNYQLPAIIHWKFSHFLVLEGFRKDGGVYFNDPGMGPRVVTAEEFDQYFTGVALTFEPGPDFQMSGRRSRMFPALKSRLAASGTALAFIALTALMLVIPGIIIPTFTRIFVDNFLVARLDGWLKPLLIAMALTGVIYGILTWLQQHYLERLYKKLDLANSASFLWHVLRLPFAYFTQRFGGEIGSRVEINSRVAKLLSDELATAVLGIFTMIFFVVTMLFYDVLLTAVGVFMAALNIVALQYISRKRVDGNEKLLMEQGKLIGASMNGLRMIETLKATGSEDDFFSYWAGYHAKTLNAQQELGLLTQLLNAVPSFLFALNTTAILAIGGLRVMDGHLSMGMLVAFQGLMTSFLEPVTTLVNLGSKIQTTAGDMKRLDDVLMYETDPALSSGNAPEVSEETPVKLNGHIELRNITFGYSPLDPPLIENFNLTVAPGARVALVGRSGSGKSTGAKVVSGLFAAWDGEVRFDGLLRGDIPRTAINNSLAVVDQDIFLFEGTVRDNLTMWDTTIPESSIIQAAKDASIHDDIASRPGGYESKVEEGGRNFSGGQRQRLEIARALTGNPTILVLDEATSALDPLTEKIIDNNLRRRGCTCLIIAHRLSTIRDCDEIIVMEMGKVVQRGTHEEMKLIDGPYAHLIED